MKISPRMPCHDMTVGSDFPEKKTQKLATALLHPGWGGVDPRGFCFCFSRWCFQIFVIFTPKIGEMIHFDEHIFQMS